MRDPRIEAWLDATIADLWPGARCGSLAEVAGDASSRVYARVSLSDSQQVGDSCPSSVVLMILQDAGVAMSSDELGVFAEGGPDELPFVNVLRFMARSCSAVPRLYAVSDSRDLLLLEDLGDTALWDAAVLDAADPLALFTAALELLAAMQRDCIDDGSGCYAFGQAFDHELFTWEVDHFLEYGLLPAAASGIDECRDELALVVDRLAALPRVFCHRDYHAWNLMVQGGGDDDPRIRLIDFQDALMAPSLYDVASLLTDRVTPTLLQPGLESELLARWHSMADSAAGLSFDQVVEQYEWLALQRVLKVVGRFNYLATVKGKPAYARMLPGVVATARRFAARVEGLPVTRRLLDEQVREKVPA